MFDTLFRYPRVLARHRQGPFAEAREQFVSHCARAGVASATQLRIARELLVIASRVDLSGECAIPMAEVEASADRWVRYQQRRHRIHRTSGSRKLFVQTATSWLRFLGRLEEPLKTPAPFADLLNPYGNYLRQERGLSPRTIDHYSWYVRAFLRWAEEQGRGLAEIRFEEIDAFLALKRAQGWCRVSMTRAVNSLRSFFRYAAAHGLGCTGLADGIQAPRRFAHEALPVGPAWEEVKRLIASTATERPQDIRDRAIFLLFAVYGLRVGEVAVLKLEDVNFEQEILRVTRPKQRVSQDYPLVGEVGEAILRYLQHVRPRAESRSLFLTLRAPWRGLLSTSLCRLVRARMAALGIVCQRRGPHALRHACAAHLVAEGFSLKAIGDHLGHRSTEATRIYAKVDVVGLREVAELDLGDLL